MLMQRLAPQGAGTVDCPLVLLPGTLCDERLFAPVLARLKIAEHRVLPLDGGSTAAEVAEALIGRLPDRFALAGFSLGGIVALELARRVPDRVAGLALIGSNARPVPEDQILARRISARFYNSEPIATHIQRLWPHYVGDASSGDSRLRRLLIDMAAGGGREALARQTEIALTRADSRPYLPDLAMPALVLAGEEDALCPIVMQLEMAKALPAARLALIPRAGHFAPLEAPDAVAAHLNNWLQLVSRYA